MDPFTVAAAISFLGTVVTAVVVITLVKIIDWFRSRGKIKAENKDAIAFTLAERINNKKYVEVGGVFDGRPTNTRIVQGFYDQARDQVLDVRALSSNRAPTDAEIQRNHDEGQGLVVYS